MSDNRLLFVCPTCSPIGGLQTWLDVLCAGLENRGWQPIVALVHGPTTNDSVAYKAAHPVLSTLTVDGSAMTMAARVREVMRVTRKVKPAFYIPLTVIDAHDAVCALKLEGQFKGRYVLSLHGNLPQQIADATLFQPFADLSVTPGALTCRLLRWAGMPDSHIFHAPNGADAHCLRRVDTDRTGPIRLAYVGRLTNEDKRVLDLVAVVGALEQSRVNYRLDIAGNGPCEEVLRERLAQDCVRFHGFVDPDVLHQQYYPNWDVLLMCSQSEAFGISLLEAMTHGVVPVSSRFVGHRSEGFLRERQTAMLFDVGDTAGCAEAIRTLDEDRDLLSSLSRQAHELATQQYGWQRCTDAWEHALKHSQALDTRVPPQKLPRRLDEGNSLAARFSWLPRRVSDNYYKTKRTFFGIPEAMKRGEEWPFHTSCFDAEALHRIESVTIEMDRQS